MPDLESLSNYFDGLWMAEKPIVKLFKTETMGYLYDTGTNKIVACDELEYLIIDGFITEGVTESLKKVRMIHGLDKTIGAANRIKHFIEKEKILLARRATQFGYSQYHNFEDLVDSSFKILVLETTERCNYRCRYCIYNPAYAHKRNHSDRSMSASVASASIDYLDKHSSKLDSVSITFYGGEPLMEFDFIRSCVDYSCSAINKNKTINYSLTTNGSLITNDVARYLNENAFSITLSLDGPKEDHDSYRIDSNNKGTFERTIKGLINLHEAFGDSFSTRVVINTVYTPPYSEAKLDRLTSLWDTLPWLPKDLSVQLTYPTPGTIPEMAMTQAVPEDKGMQQWAIDRYVKQLKSKDDRNPVFSSLVERELAILLKRPIYISPIDKYNLNGCCVPGERRLFVTTNGEFRVCERISADAPTIGNVYSGLNKQAIRKIYIDDYEAYSLPRCSVCWGIRLCKACYSHADYDGGWVSGEEKDKLCNAYLSSRQRFLILLCSLLEKDPECLTHLNNYDIR
jgi:uncharacterized protein